MVLRAMSVRRAATDAAPSPLAAIRALAPAIRARADEIEQARQVPLDLIQALAETGAFRLCIPHAFGGADVVTGGVFAPRGEAVVVEGGYRTRGRWAFGSGSEHCRWLLGGCVVVEDGKPRLLGRGIPDSRMMFFPASDVRIVDTWTV